MSEQSAPLALSTSDFLHLVVTDEASAPISRVSVRLLAQLTADIGAQPYAHSESTMLKDGRLSLQVARSVEELDVSFSAEGFEPTGIQLIGEGTWRSAGGEVRHQQISLRRLPSNTGIHVLDRRKLTPIAGARLAVASLSGGLANRDYAILLTTDSEGRARCSWPRSEVALRVDAPGYVPLFCQSALIPTNEVQVELEPSGKLAGTVLDHLGQTIPGLAIAAHLLVPDEDGTLQPDQFVQKPEINPGGVRFDGQSVEAWFVRGFSGYPTLTDAEGRFVLRGFPTGQIVAPSLAVPNFHDKIEWGDAKVGDPGLVLRVVPRWPVALYFDLSDRMEDYVSSRVEMECDVIDTASPHLLSGNRWRFPLNGNSLPVLYYLPEGRYRLRCSVAGQDLGFETIAAVVPNATCVVRIE